MTDKIAETVARLLRQSEQAYALADTAQNSESWRLEARGALLRISKAGYDAADLLESLARDLAAARDRAEKAEAERDGLKITTQGLRAATTRVIVGEGEVRREWRDRAEAAEADRDRLAAELAEARTVQAAAGVLLDAVDDAWTPQASTATYDARKAAERAGHKYRVIDREGFRAALRALAKGDTP